ncbi:MAG: hypothetical protein ACFCU6_04465 [Balneolaceae bacterium]
MNEKPDLSEGSKIRRFILTALLYLSLLLQTGFSQQKTNQKPDIQFDIERGLRIQAADSSASLRIGLRFQEQFSARFETDEDRSDLEFQVRRFRLIFAGHFLSDRLTYFFMPSFDRGKASLELMRVQWKLSENSWIYGGQINLPGTREFLQNSGTLQFVDRSTSNRLFRLGFDTGLGYKQKFFPGQTALIGIATITNGEGQNQRAARGGLSYTGRLEFYPFGEFNSYIGSDFERSRKPQLVIAGAYNYNQDAVRTRSHLGNFLTDASANIITGFLESSARYRGFSFHTGYAVRSANNNLLNDGNPQNYISEGKAFYLESGYLLPQNWEIVSLFERIYPDKQLREIMSGERSFLIGINKYIIKHRLKFQTDFKFDSIIVSSAENQDIIVFRTQFQIEF